MFLSQLWYLRPDKIRGCDINNLTKSFLGYNMDLCKRFLKETKQYNRIVSRWSGSLCPLFYLSLVLKFVADINENELFCL